MPVLKNRTQGRFVIVSIAPLRDPKLSTRERGLLCTIMSLPDNWEFSVRGLAKILPDGRDSLGSSIQVLEEKGYLSRWQDRNEKGTFGGNFIEVHEYPVIGQSVDGILPQKNTEKPVTAHPATGSPTQYNIKEYKNISESINLSLNQSGDKDGFDTKNPASEYEQKRQEIEDQVCYPALLNDHPEQADTIEMIVELMLAVDRTEQETIRIGGSPLPVSVVRSMFARLDQFHVEYVLNGLQSAGRIRNPAAYLLTSLYRSVNAIKMHTDNQVKNDFFDWTETEAVSDKGKERE